MSTWPLRLPFSGNCDGAGNFSSKLGGAIHPAYYSVARLVGQTVGSGATWLINDGAGLPLELGQGNLVSLNPMLINPNEMLTLAVQSATSFAPVKGQLIGVQANTLDEVLRYYLPGPNPLNISVQGAVSIVGGQGNFSDIIVSGLVGALTSSHWVGAVNGVAPTVAGPVAGMWAVDVQGGFWVYDGTGWRWVPSLDSNGDFTLPNAGRGSGKANFKGAVSVSPSAGAAFAPSSYGSLGVKLAEKKDAAATYDFTSIPTGYRFLELVWCLRNNSAATSVIDDAMTFNADTGLHYNDDLAIVSNSTDIDASTVGVASLAGAASSGNGQAAGQFCQGFTRIFSYSDTVTRKAYTKHCHRVGGDTLGQNSLAWSAGHWQTSNAAINEITLTPGAGTGYVAGSWAILIGHP